MKTARVMLGIVGLLAFASFVHSQQSTYDLLLTNGRIVDGTGNPWFRGEVAIRGDAIVLIAPHIDGSAARIIDVGGNVIAPGFIDIHTHASRGIFEVPTAPNYVRQGVTTIMEGPDGSSPVPLAPFLDRLAALKISLNIGSFIGQGSIRTTVIGNVNRKATPEEITKMQGLVEQGMKDGAFGLSTGLFYVPGTFSSTAEIVELAKIAGRSGGMHESHQRDDAARLLDSVKEIIAIGEGGNLPTQISHQKVIGAPNFGKGEDALKLIEEARARGVDVTSDQYPYTASSTSIQAALLPAWALEGDRQAILAKLKNPSQRSEIKADTVMMLRDERGGGDPKNVQLANCGFDASLAGKTLADVMRQRSMPMNLDNAAEATFWIVEQGGCQGIFHAMAERDLEAILRHPTTSISSDSELPIFGRANPHPRSYGTFARVLGLYVREKHTLTLEDAIRKMTSFPAQRLNLGDRGVLRAGMKADIAIFDPARVRDTATFENPHQYAEGFSQVIVNGQIVYENGAMTEARPGRVLYGPGKR